VRIFALDPGLHHIMWTLTEWEPDEGDELPPTHRQRLVKVHDTGKLEIPRKCRRKSLDAVLDTTSLISEFRWVDLPYADHAVVEAQHFKARSVRASDIRDLAMVTGAVVCCLPYETRFAPTGPGGWSVTKKAIRHARMTDFYFPYFDFDAAFSNFGVRETGDLMDTVGMAYWSACGCPRSGI